MIKVGLISDTHGQIDDKIIRFFNHCNEIWHAGDIGNFDVPDQLKKICSFRAVYGNIDGSDIRLEYKKHCRFKCEDIDVWITHIGGYPGNYSSEVKPEIFNNPPKLFISGHSHILKVINDKKLKLLHINPGAAGFFGPHTIRTAIRFNIHKDKVTDMEVLEIPRH